MKSVTSKRASAAALVAFGLVSGAAGAGLFASKHEAPRPEMASVLFTIKRLDVGSSPSSSNTECRQVVWSEVTDGAVSCEDLPLAAKRTLVLDLGRGVPLMVSHFGTSSREPSLSERIPPGKRLFILKAQLGELAPYVKPGVTVDVLANMNLPDIGPATETLLEAVRVVRITGDDPSASEGAEAQASAASGSGGVETHPLSFYLTPDEVKLLTYAQSFATFSVILRNPRDRQGAGGSTAMTLNRFMGDARIRRLVESNLWQVKRGGERGAEAPAAADEVLHGKK